MEMESTVRAMREKAAFAAKSSERPGSREDQKTFWRGIAKAWEEAAEMIEVQQSREDQKRWFQVVVTDVDSDGAPMGVNRVVAIVKGSDEATQVAKCFDREIGVGMFEQVDIIVDGRFISW